MAHIFRTTAESALSRASRILTLMILGLLLIGPSCSDKVMDEPEPDTAPQSVISDFDDGTAGGWTKRPNFGGTLENPGEGGNPSGYLQVADNTSGGGGLVAIAPPQFSGDLSVYSGIRWDEFIWPNSPSPNYCTYPIIEASDGTRYRLDDRSPRPEGAWHQRYVPLEASYWKLNETTGTTSFEDAIRDVAALMMSMDVSKCSYRKESGIDNVMLVVEPQ